VKRPARAGRSPRAGRRAADPLAPLTVITRLEVGPTRLERRRLVTPYRVQTPRGSAETELTYSYEEDVFDPSEPSDRNLAQVIGSQVALNYGLFCEEIVIRGSVDAVDRSFLTTAARNTAREIYVKKLLEPNPFLRGPVASLPLVRRRDYLRARLSFPDPPAGSGGCAPWATSRERHAVLSSGGKDSLLAFGLLRELGREVHPVFVNESGRHWFTALNAYRHLAQHVPETGRVWTSSDRVFSWMLRHLPFVRPDFADLRSDEYPIRLWTVAVFLFGVLPVLRKRGIGRLLVGDEHDTTRRSSFRGISHYDGLYDQSRFFDEAVSRYFRRKGWNVAQFSVLRPLSELLIQKILAERYPDLLRLQVSCHAAHRGDDAVRPCGRCEKCRRIVAMLVALGQEPDALGYGPEQVGQILKDLPSRGMHQESAGVAHVGHLLRDKGLLEGTTVGGVRARSHAEVLAVRIDPLRSPLSAVPRDLLQPLVPLFLEHATGAVRRVGRVWVETDLVKDAANPPPYPFERPSDGSAATGAPGSRPAFLLAEMTWPEAAERLRHVDVALLPVGSLEQHGPHLPLDTDAYDAELTARRVAAACSEPRPLVLPLIPYGVSYAHEDFAGTLGVSPDTLARIVHEIGLGVAREGITKLVIVNGHGGNGPALHFAAQLVNRDAHIFTCVDTGETSDADVAEISDVKNDAHAGDIETSTSLATRPELVRMDRAVAYVPEFSSSYLDFSARRSVGWYARTARISPTGVFGDPTRASREKGERIWEISVRRLVELVESLKRLSLDEIYQKRY
jgi:creatinine amidohydrolase/Fe(II)-dependent formamide hydrolase-like protein/7-cyano-7-deazaguanine synthase in queuosine biosynthesis